MRACGLYLASVLAPLVLLGCATQTESVDQPEVFGSTVALQASEPRRCGG
jgi:hypothetical protein